MSTFIDLIEADSRNAMASIEPASVHLALTDPPYFLDGLDSEWRKGNVEPNQTKSTAIGGLPVAMKFDKAQGRALQSFMEDAGSLMLQALKPGAFAVVFSQPRLTHRMASGLEDAGFDIRDLFAWHFTKKAQYKAFSMDHFVDKMDIEDAEKDRLKADMKDRRTPQLKPSFESIILAQKPKHGTHVDNWVRHRTGLFDASQTLDGYVPSTVMSVEKSNKGDFDKHLTIKPLKLMTYLIRLFSEPSQVVLDPFLGSGITAIACRYTKRSCIGIDINHDYVEIAKQRIKDYDQFELQ